MKNKVIDITTSTGRDLKSRIAVREFRDLILSQNADLIIIDFKNVNFATRSFIDEFYNVIINNTEIHTELLNISSEIQAMFDAVKLTQHVAKSFPANRKSSKVVKFSSVSEVNKYLSSLSFL